MDHSQGEESYGTFGFPPPTSHFPHIARMDPWLLSTIEEQPYAAKLCE